jgi:hypothetical protein
MADKIYSTLREATHETYSACSDKQGLAWDLEWDKAEMSNRTTQADGYRPFPADDKKERLVGFMLKTGNFSYLMTLAEKCGYEISPKRDRLPEMLASTGQQVAELIRSFEQMKLMIPLADSVSPKVKR